MPQVGIAGNIQEVYGSQVWANWFALGPRARNLKTCWWFEDFITYNATNSTEIGGIITSYASGAGSGTTHVSAQAARPGILRMMTGTTNAGYSSLLSSYAFATAGFLFGAGEYTLEGDIYIPDLSTALEEYFIIWGWGDAYGAATDGVYFLYDRTASVNWQAVTANNAARTTTDTGVAVAEDVWIRPRIFVDGPGANAYFYLDDVLVATNAANIPTAAGRQTGLLMVIRKTVGTTSRDLYMDWFWYHHDLTASR